jgi:hypothetical protein
MLEKCPNCMRNHIAFSSRWVIKIEPTEIAQQGRILILVGAMCATTAMGIALGINGVGLRSTLQEVARQKRHEQQIAEWDEEQMAVRQTTVMTMAETETVTRNMKVTETETETRTWATAD